MGTTAGYLRSRCGQPSCRLLLRSSRRNSFGLLRNCIRSASTAPSPEQDAIDPPQNIYKTVSGSPPAFTFRNRELFFDPLFVRDSCTCNGCVDSQTHQKKFDTAEIPGDISVQHVFDDGNSVRIKWRRDIPGHGPTHVTRKSKVVLASSTPSYKRDPASIYPRLWPKYFQPTRFFQYKDFVQRQDSFRQAILELARNGIVILKDVPEAESSVEAIGETIGPLRHTFYGRTWDVKDKPDAANVADTSGHLGLHMDLLYMQKPPGFQLLHCIKSSSEGGESIFADGIRVARTLEVYYPELFHILATFPVKYQYIHPGKTYMDEKYTIELPIFSSKDDVTPGSLSLFSNINYSPLFQGEFSMDACSEGDAKMLRKYHKAIQMFANLLEKPAHQFRYRLQPGECVIFNNRRILHGRTEFSHAGRDQSEPRWLKGAYLDTDDFLSVVRTIDRENRRMVYQ